MKSHSCLFDPAFQNPEHARSSPLQRAKINQKKVIDPKINKNKGSIKNENQIIKNHQNNNLEVTKFASTTYCLCENTAPSAEFTAALDDLGRTTSGMTKSCNPFFDDKLLKYCTSATMHWTGPLFVTLPVLMGLWTLLFPLWVWVHNQCQRPMGREPPPCHQHTTNDLSVNDKNVRIISWNGCATKTVSTATTVIDSHVSECVPDVCETQIIRDVNCAH